MHVHVRIQPKRVLCIILSSHLLQYTSTSLEVRLVIGPWGHEDVPEWRVSVELCGKGESKRLPVTMSSRAKDVQLTVICWMFDCRSCITKCIVNLTYCHGKIASCFIIYLSLVTQVWIHQSLSSPEVYE